MLQSVQGRLNGFRCLSLPLSLSTVRRTRRPSCGETSRSHYPTVEPFGLGRGRLSHQDGGCEGDGKRKMDKRKKREGQIGEKVAGDALEASRPLLHSQQHTPRALQSDDRDQRPSQRNSTPRRRKHRLRGAKTTTTPAKLSIAVPQSGEEGGDDGREGGKGIREEPERGL
jgi:hypothetical protein